MHENSEMLCDFETNLKILCLALVTARKVKTEGEIPKASVPLTWYPTGYRKTWPHLLYFVSPLSCVTWRPGQSADPDRPAGVPVHHPRGVALLLLEQAEQAWDCSQHCGLHQEIQPRVILDRRGENKYSRIPGLFTGKKPFDLLIPVPTWFYFNSTWFFQLDRPKIRIQIIKSCGQWGYGRIVNLENLNLSITKVSYAPGYPILNRVRRFFKFLFKSCTGTGGHKRVECTYCIIQSSDIKCSRKTFLFQRSISHFVRFMNAA